MQPVLELQRLRVLRAFASKIVCGTQNCRWSQTTGISSVAVALNVPQRDERWHSRSAAIFWPSSRADSRTNVLLSLVPLIIPSRGPLARRDLRGMRSSFILDQCSTQEGQNPAAQAKPALTPLKISRLSHRQMRIISYIYAVLPPLLHSHWPSWAPLFHCALQQRSGRLDLLLALIVLPGRGTGLECRWERLSDSPLSRTSTLKSGGSKVEEKTTIDGSTMSASPDWGSSDINERL